MDPSTLEFVAHGPFHPRICCPKSPLFSGFSPTHLENFFFPQFFSAVKLQNGKYIFSKKKLGEGSKPPTRPNGCLIIHKLLQYETIQPVHPRFWCFRASMSHETQAGIGSGWCKVRWRFLGRKLEKKWWRVVGAVVVSGVFFKQINLEG